MAAWLMDQFALPVILFPAPSGALSALVLVENQSTFPDLIKERAMRVYLVVFLIALITGCSDGAGKLPIKIEAERTSNLRDLGEMLRLAGKPVAKVADLAAVKNQFDETFRLLEKGEIVVVWGAQMPGEGSPGTTDIVGYLKKVPTEGGLVLLLNGAIKQMSASEFGSAKKAK
jgi:hypothetical protein